MAVSLKQQTGEAYTILQILDLVFLAIETQVYGVLQTNFEKQSQNSVESICKAALEDPDLLFITVAIDIADHASDLPSAIIH